MQRVLDTPRGPLAIRTGLLLDAWTLPRWFALPVAVLGVLLGGLVGAGSQTTALRLVLVALSAGLVMAWGHSMNALLDYNWTKLDQGEGRSRTTPYTGGQQALADGLVTPAEVLVNALAWLALSAAPLVLLSRQGYRWPWLFSAVAALCTFPYSCGKLNWLCEGAKAGLTCERAQGNMLGRPPGSKDRRLRSRKSYLLRHAL